MAEPTGTTAPQSKPKRRIRNYLLDRRFQLKYALLLSGMSALLMAAMGTLLYMRMKDSEQRLGDEARYAHAGINSEADAAALMVRREMEISAQQLINRQLPCVAPPSCPPAPQPGTAPGVTTQGTGAACDAETCKPLCEALGIKPPADAAPPADAPPAAPPPADTATTPPSADAAPAPAPNAAAEADKPPEPVNPAPADEQDRQRELIRKIEETVKAETAQRATEMENETRTRLAALDAETLKRIDGLRAANDRDLRAILVTLVIIFLVLAAVGIVVTHKVVGPIYRMKMLVGKIDGDHLALQGKLRKGDELQDLFEEVQQMLDRLRGHQESEVSTLGGLLDKLKGCTSDADRGPALADLEKFRARMAAALDKK
jgi:hypothetical protein